MRIRFLVARVLALLTVVAIGSAPGVASAQSDGASQQTVKDAMRALDALAIYTDRLPRETFDPDAVLQGTGTDAEAIFAWIRDNTTFVAYAGRLRGAAGVLIDRQGNSLDRALLLADLLVRAGHEVRLAQGTLATAEVDRFLAAWRDRPSQASATMPDAEVNARLLEALAEVGFPTDRMSDWLEEQSGLRAEALAEFQQRNAALTDGMLGLLEPWLRPDTDGDAAARQAAVADHWWVQVRQGDSWLDLDPSLPDAGTGEALTAAAQTYPVEALPPKLDHRVTFRVVAERWRDEGLERVPLLDETITAGDKPTLRFRLAFLPMGVPVTEEAAEVATRAYDYIDGAVAETEWLPMLFLDDELVIWRFADIDGEILDANEVEIEATRLGQIVGGAVEEGLGGALDLLGGLPTGEEGPPADGDLPALREDRALTAVWIEIEVRGPGHEPRVERRTVFDLLDGLPAEERAGRVTMIDERARRARALGLLSEIEGIVTFVEPSDLFLAYEAGRHWLGQREQLKAIVKAAAQADLNTVLAKTEKLDSWPASLFSFAQMRRSLLALRVQGYLDAPLVVARFNSLEDTAEGTPVASQGIDIVSRPTGHPHDGEGAVRDRIAQGVLDTLLEAVLLEEDETARNAALQFLGTEPTDWRVVPPSTEGEPLVVMVPNESGSGPDVWWRVDPVSGETLGVDAEGRGSAIAEWLIVKLNVTREQMVMYRALGCVIAAKVSTATMIIGLLNDRADTGSALEATRDPAYQVTRGAAKQIACLFAAATFGMPGTGLYRAGAAIGAVNIAETVIGIGIGGYLHTIGD